MKMRLAAELERRNRSVLPFEGFRFEPVPRRCRHRRGCLSWGRLRFGVLICNRLVGLSVPHARRALVVSAGADGFYRLPSPVQLPRQVHPPVRFTPLQSTAVPNPPRASRRRAPSMGLALPSSRRQPAASLQRGSNPAALPPSAFLTPSTVCSAAGLVGLFHPTATSRVSLQGFSLPHSRCASSTPRCPLVG
jgi:hypothetical protein